MRASSIGCLVSLLVLLFGATAPSWAQACDPACPGGQTCFSGCGELIQGVECVLFQADAGGLYVLSNYGGFNVGDRVSVVGCHDPGCITFCMQGDGCLLDNTIELCEQPVIPTVSQWGLIVMTLVLFAAGTLVLRTRRKTTA